jgi:hypothetical protein
VRRLVRPRGLSLLRRGSVIMNLNPLDIGRLTVGLHIPSGDEVAIG